MNKYFLAEGVNTGYEQARLDWLEFDTMEELQAHVTKVKKEEWGPGITSEKFETIYQAFKGERLNMKDLFEDD